MMPVTRTVIVSFATEDTLLCQPLLAALDAWGVSYYAAPPAREASQALDPATQKAIADGVLYVTSLDGYLYAYQPG